MINIPPSGGGGGGGGGTTAPFVYPQINPSATWVIDHNLGYKPASVTVEDSAGDQVVGDVSRPTVNRVVIAFRNAFSGTAYIL